MVLKESRNGVNTDGNTMDQANKSKALLIFSITILLVVLDQITKLLIQKIITGSITIINNILYLSFIKNTGAAFGILKNQTMLLVWFSVIVIGVILFVYDKIPKIKVVQIFTALILGGTVSNLIDRLRLGYVVDFIDFKIWPAFNLADAGVTIGCIGLIIYFMKK